MNAMGTGWRLGLRAVYRRDADATVGKHGVFAEGIQVFWHVWGIDTRLRWGTETQRRGGTKERGNGWVFAGIFHVFWEVSRGYFVNAMGPGLRAGQRRNADAAVGVHGVMAHWFPPGGLTFV